MSKSELRAKSVAEAVNLFKKELKNLLGKNLLLS